MPPEEEKYYAYPTKYTTGLMQKPYRPRYITGSGPYDPEPEPSDPYAGNSIFGGGKCEDKNCSMCYPESDTKCSDCRERDMQIKALVEQAERDEKTIAENTKVIAEQGAKVIDLTARLAEAESQRDEFDREADNLAAVYDRVVIERDYLLKIRKWSDDELSRAWERLEELNAAA